MKKTTIPANRPPKTLSKDAAALWRCYVDELESRQMFADADRAALERLCVLEVQAGKLALQIETEGVLQQDRDGTTRRNPALMALQGISQIIEGLKRSLSIGAYYRHRIGEAVIKEPTKPSILSLMRPKDSPEYKRAMEYFSTKDETGT